jgi:hypothetical protein
LRPFKYPIFQVISTYHHQEERKPGASPSDTFLSHRICCLLNMKLNINNYQSISQNEIFFFYFLQEDLGNLFGTYVHQVLKDIMS